MQKTDIINIEQIVLFFIARKAINNKIIDLTHCLPEYLVSEKIGQWTPFLVFVNFTNFPSET